MKVAQGPLNLKMTTVFFTLKAKELAWNVKQKKRSVVPKKLNFLPKILPLPQFLVWNLILVKELLPLMNYVHNPSSAKERRHLWTWIIKMIDIGKNERKTTLQHDAVERLEDQKRIKLL